MHVDPLDARLGGGDVLFGGVELGLADLDLRAGLAQIELADGPGHLLAGGLAAPQIAPQAFELGLLFEHAGLGDGELGLGLGEVFPQAAVVDLDQHVAGLDVLGLVELDGDDAAGLDVGHEAAPLGPQAAVDAAFVLDLG